MLVASLCVLLRLALNRGQHPWESNPEGVIRSCCNSSVENEEGKCICGFSIVCLPLAQALTKGEGVIRKSSGWGTSVVQSLFVFFLPFSRSFIPFMGRLVMGFFCDELPIKVFTLLKLLVKCTDFMHVVCTLFQIMCKNTHSAC